MASSAPAAKLQVAAQLTIGGVKWRDLQVAPRELRPNLSLQMGQCFNWFRLGVSGESGLWVGLVGSRAVGIKQTPETTMFCSLVDDEDEDMKGGELYDVLRAYFCLDDYNLVSCYEAWSKADTRMAVVVEHLVGVRVVRQEPWECLVSFICSSNNNIKRITLMLDRLKITYGKYVCTVEPSKSGAGWVVVHRPSDSSAVATPSVGGPSSPAPVTPMKPSSSPSSTSSAWRSQSLDLFSFPTPSALAAASESDLRALGVGYRAKFIRGSAEKVVQKVGGGNEWLLSLRTKSCMEKAESSGTAMHTSKTTRKSKSKSKNTNEVCPPVSLLAAGESQEDRQHRLFVQEQLSSLPGIGPKVADCIALFACDQREAIPVDTHVHAIAIRDFNPSLASHASITPSVYEAIGDEFRKRFIPYAGLAHSVLFAAELPEFRAVLPAGVQSAMKEFAAQRAADKKLKREEAGARKRERAEAAGIGAGVGADIEDAAGSASSSTKKKKKKEKEVAREGAETESETD